MLNRRAHHLDSTRAESLFGIRCYASGWLYLAHVTLTTSYLYVFVHNVQIKTFRISRTCLLYPKAREDRNIEKGQSGSRTLGDDFIRINQQDEWDSHNMTDNRDESKLDTSINAPQQPASCPPDRVYVAKMQRLLSEAASLICKPLQATRPQTTAADVVK